MKLGLVVAALLSWFSLSGCVSLFSHREATFKQQGVTIGFETDSSTRQTSPLIPNNHPARLTKKEVSTLLGSLEVSGYSGSLVGIFISPPRRPLFTEAELHLISEPIANAFLQAGPYERVFFSIPDPDKPYRLDRLKGALFIRDPYLHVIVTDHYAYLRADTGGGDDDKDPRDMKGMHLWVAGPSKAASLPPNQEPRWSPLETVHISLNIHEVLAAQSGAPAKTEP